MSFLYRACPIFFVSLFLLFTASGQIINIEKARVSEDSSNYFTGKLGLSLSLFNQANGDVGKEGQAEHYLGLTGTGNIGYVSEENTYLLLSSYNFVRLRGNTEVEKSTVHGRVTFRRKHMLSYEVYSQWQYDYNQGLELRTLAGAGVRFSVVKTKDIGLHLGTGVMYEHERWKDKVEGRYINKSIPKLSNYVSVRLPLNPYLELNTIHYYQVGYDQSEGIFRHRISGDLSFNIKVNNRLQLMTNFSHTYDSNPIVAIPKYIYSLTNGLQLSF